MATHEVPLDGTDHEHAAVCPCKPARRDRAGGGVVYAHQDRRPAEALDEQGPEADCGHIVIDVDGEQQHHEIPDDGAPHAPTTECGCGPQRETRDGHAVIVHADQDADDEWEGGPQ